MTDRLAAMLAVWNEEERREGVPPEDRSFMIETETGARPWLLIHGGGGRPSDFRPFAEALARAGHASLCPLLPAHARGDLAMGALRFEDLVGRAAQAWDVLAEDGPPPGLVGQSLGAVIGTRLAPTRPVPAFVGLAPAFRPLAGRRVGRMLWLALRAPRLARASWRWQVEARRGIQGARELLTELRCPLLVLASSDDPTVSPRGGEEMVERAGSADKEFVALDGQGHVLSNAPDLEAVVRPVREWMARI